MTKNIETVYLVNKRKKKNTYFLQQKIKLFLGNTVETFKQIQLLGLEITLIWFCNFLSLKRRRTVETKQGKSEAQL